MHQQEYFTNTTFAPASAGMPVRCSEVRSLCLCKCNSCGNSNCWISKDIEVGKKKKKKVVVQNETGKMK